MKNIALLLSLSLLSCSLSAELEIRDASHSPINGYTEATYDAGKEKRKVYLDSAVLLSSKDLADAFAQETGATYSVSLTFTDESSIQLRKLTEKRINKEIAFIIDGEVLSVVTIMAPIGKNAQLTSFSKSEAEKLAKKILNHN